MRSPFGHRLQGFQNLGDYMKDVHPLIGSWRLEAFELEMPDGSKTYPYGQDLTGYLFYNEAGFMSAAFMNAERGRVPDGRGRDRGVNQEGVEVRGGFLRGIQGWLRFVRAVRRQP